MRSFFFQSIQSLPRYFQGKTLPIYHQKWIDFQLNKFDGIKVLDKLLEKFTIYVFEANEETH